MDETPGVLHTMREHGDSEDRGASCRCSCGKSTQRTSETSCRRVHKDIRVSMRSLSWDHRMEREVVGTECGVASVNISKSTGDQS